MNQMQAMKDTVALMERRIVDLEEEHGPLSDIDWRDLNEDLRPSHVRQMLRVMESGVNPQDTERSFSDAKMGRWLGWAQAAVVAMGIASLDDMKSINKANMESTTQA